MSLAEDVEKKRHSIEPNIRDVVDELVAISTEIELPSCGATLRSLETALLDSVFNLGVVGRFNNGKSSLINALLSSAAYHSASPQHSADPLPVGRFPTTAVCTNLVFSASVHVDAIHRNGTKEGVELERFYQRARVQGGDAEWLEDIDEFVVGFPSRLLRAGTTIVDTPGDDEDLRRTEITRQALERTDAAIIVYNTHAIAGKGELEFARIVSERVGKTFTVVNLVDGHPLDGELLNAVAERLGHLDQTGRPLDLIEQDVFIVNVKAALEGFRLGDNRRIRESGILDLEKRLSEFLLNEKYAARTTRIVQQIDEEAASLTRLQAKLCSDLSGKIDEIRREIDANERELEEVQRRRDTIADLIDEAERPIRAEASRGYRLAIQTIEARLEIDFGRENIPALATFWGRVKAGFKNEAAKQATSILEHLIVDGIRAWSENPVNKPGLQTDISYTVERLRRDIGRQLKEIREKLESVNLEIGATEIGVNSAPVEMYSQVDRIIGGILGTIAFGPLGLAAAAGGTRAAVGSVVGAAGGALGTALIGMFVTITGPFGITAMIVGAIGGALVGGSAGVEKRVRQKAVEAFRGPLRAYIESETTYRVVEDRVSQGLATFKKALLHEVDYLINIEKEKLRSRRKTLHLSRDEQDVRFDVLTRTGEKISATRRQLIGILAGLRP